MGLPASLANYYSMGTPRGLPRQAGMFPSIDTKDPVAVARVVRDVQSRLFPQSSLDITDRLFADVQIMFAGRYLDYLPIDLKYHDFQHTLQATLCMAELIDGWHAAGQEPSLTSRQFEEAVAAIVLHDTGYLKLRSDTSGTGAKYTYTHVLRSCAVAATYLPTLGFNLAEIDVVLGAIRCTGPTANIRRLQFKNKAEEMIGCCVATADYLGQMAASDYPEELPILFSEFEESDDYLHVPPERRAFKSTADLIAKTPIFWKKVVLPKLHKDFQQAYRFLARPYPDGPNPYLEAIERNISIIQKQTVT